MAKQRAPSKHSRAARRATSPSIDTDKSLKDIKPPSRSSSSSFRPSVLAIHQSSGVQKKVSKRGQKSRMSTKARRRHEKGLEMAEAVVERTSKKLQLSKTRSRSVQDRAKTWDTINKKALDGMDVALGDDDEDEDNNQEGTNGADDKDKEWETDEEMDAKKDSADAPENTEAEGYLAVDDDDDVIL